MKLLIPLSIFLQHVLARPQQHHHEAQSLGNPTAASISSPLPEPDSTSSSFLSSLPPGTILEPDLDTTKPGITPGAKLVKIKVGPITVQPMQMYTNYTYIPMPCTDCFITALQGGLEYENGTAAHIDSGAWLHHMTMSNIGKTDLVCGYSGFQRMYSAGNEREVSRINVNGLKYGLSIGPLDQYTILAELMNQNAHPISVYITQTYEYVIGPASTSYKPTHMIWMDITGCGISSVLATPGATTYLSPIWKSTIAGPLLFSTGHTHDGGLDTTLYVNNRTVCTNAQIYGRRKEYIEKGNGRQHISDVGVCVGFGRVEVGDEVRLGVRYDSAVHELEVDMAGKGLEPVMGISRIYVGT